ncbi:Ribose import permease protein RbsC [Moorella thermoacetica]|uniref:Ribose import permease protein RbsC n=2 Tax=Neomoorella thermoacetica TaxID=1525 RepID=A0AAC9MUM3_NEOTH|nr:ABC transporter permease [Moorella thermoacetica]AOQ23641.1 Ribose transport system permease protein RbsC [Moorella thermoacetica]TYL13825.1 Ribose import permease protein RbsC [Moorella thermoacetica]
MERTADKSHKGITNSIKKDVINLSNLALLITLLALVAVFASLSPYFLTIQNLYAIGLTISVIGIVCIGQTLCLITRGFDLSVGAVAAFAGMVCAFLNNAGVPLRVSIIISLLTGALIGLLNGVLITRLKINALITTLATMSIFFGGVLIISKGYSLFFADPAFLGLANSTIFSVPTPIIILILFYVVFYIILKYTVFGRYVYAIGGNPEAARMSGIDVERLQMVIYIISSLLSAFAGLVLASRMGAAQTTAGSTYALDSIAAVILGGTSLAGGKGSVLGTLLGVIVIGVMNHGLIMLNVPPYYQGVATGIVLIIAVLLQTSNLRGKK